MPKHPLPAKLVLYLIGIAIKSDWGAAANLELHMVLYVLLDLGRCRYLESSPCVAITSVQRSSAQRLYGTNGLRVVLLGSARPREQRQW